MYEDEDDSLETDEIQEEELDRGDDEPEEECDEADNDCEIGDVVEEMAGVLGEQAEESEERECEEEVEAEVEDEAEREKEDRVEEEAADDEGENPDWGVDENEREEESEEELAESEGDVRESAVEGERDREESPPCSSWPPDGDRDLERHVDRLKSDIEKLRDSARVLPPLDADGNSECPFWHTLYAQMTEKLERMEFGLQYIEGQLPEIRREISRRWDEYERANARLEEARNPTDYRDLMADVKTAKWSIAHLEELHDRLLGVMEEMRQAIAEGQARLLPSDRRG
jgi:hypothetical protein